LLAILSLLSCVDALAGDAEQKPPYSFSATTFEARTSALEQYSELAFGLADISALVEAVKLEGETLHAKVVEVYRGFQTPKLALLNGFREINPRKYPAGGRWLVAARHAGDVNARVIDILPDSKDNRQAVKTWSLPGWKMMPVVVAARIERRRDEKTDGFDRLFRTVAVLRGKGVPKVFVCNERKYGKVTSLQPGKQLFVLGLHYISSASPKMPLPYASIGSMRAIDESDVAKIKIALRAAPFGGLQKALRHEAGDMRRLEQAWQFHHAPVVADVKVSGLAGEMSGMGGLHISYEPVRMLRGALPKTLPPPPKSGFPVLPGLKPGILYGGGHGYLGRERLGQRFLAASTKVGGRTTVRLPHTDANRRWVEYCLRQRLLAFVCRRADLKVLKQPGALAKLVNSRPMKRSQALFFRPVALRAALGASPGNWATFRIEEVRGDGRSNWYTARILHGTHGVSPIDWCGKWSRDSLRKNTTWAFVVRTQEVSRLWRRHGRITGLFFDDGSRSGPEGKAFVPGVFLPARFPYGSGLAYLAGRLRYVREYKDLPARASGSDPAGR